MKRLFFVATVLLYLFGAVSVFADSEDERADLLSMIGSSVALGNAFENFGEELSERLSTTPLQGFGMLVRSIEDGQVTFDFDYRNERFRQGEVQTETTAGTISLHSDLQNNNYAVYGDLDINGAALDFRAFVNESRVAIGSSVLGEVYGVEFDALRRELDRLGSDFGIDAADIDEFFQLFALEYFGAFTPISFDDEANLAVLVNFISNSMQGMENVVVNTGSQTVNARRFSFGFNDTELYNFFIELTDSIENRTGNDITLAALHGIREDMAYFESEVNADFVVAFYVGERDRLLRATISADFNSPRYGDSGSMGIAFGFGESATDTWLIDINITEDRFFSYDINFSWELGAVGNRLIHELIVTTNETSLGRQTWDDYSYTSSLRSEWNPQSGDFLISSLTSSRFGGWYDELMSGNFTVSGDTFRLSFEYSSWRESLSLEIATSTTANIDEPNFVNISDLSVEEIEEILNTLNEYWESNFRPQPVSDLTKRNDRINDWYWEDDWYWDDEYYWDDWDYDAWWDSERTFTIENLGVGVEIWSFDVYYLILSELIGEDAVIVCEEFGELTPEEWLELYLAGEF